MYFLGENTHVGFQNFTHTHTEVHRMFKKINGKKKKREKRNKFW